MHKSTSSMVISACVYILSGCQEVLSLNLLFQYCLQFNPGDLQSPPTVEERQYSVRVDQLDISVAFPSKSSRKRPTIR